MPSKRQNHLSKQSRMLFPGDWWSLKYSELLAIFFSMLHEQRTVLTAFIACSADREPCTVHHFPSQPFQPLKCGKVKGVPARLSWKSYQSQVITPSPIAHGLIFNQPMAIGYRRKAIGKGKN